MNVLATLLLPIACAAALALPASAVASELELHHDQLAALQGTLLPTDLISYQGELEDAGQPVDGAADFRFRWFPAAAGGTASGTVTLLGVPVAAGRFELVIPATFPDGGQNVFMEVAVNRDQPPAWVVLGRQELVAAPFAVFSRLAASAQMAQSAASAQTAVSAQTATSAQSAAFAQAPWLTVPNGIHYNNRVGIGTNAPALPLDLRVTGADGTALRVLHQGTALNPTGIRADVAGVGSGGSAAIAVDGVATSATGSTIGVRAASLSSSGIGLFGFAQSTSGVTDGVLGRASSPAGAAVRAWNSASSGNGYALKAETASASGFAGHFSGGRNYFEGRTGVGVESPSDRLHVAAPAGEPALRVQIDGATKLRVTENGGVSIGVNATPPANGLFVEGAIQTPPTTRWLSIDGRTFTLNNDAWSETQSVGRTEPQRVLRVDGQIRGDMISSAAVLLPHGAVVTELRAWVDDSSPDTNVRVDLMRRTLATGDAGIMATVESSGVQAGIVQLLDSTVAGASVDNQNHAYYLSAGWDVFGTSALADRTKLYAVRITYTVTSPGP